MKEWKVDVPVLLIFFARSDTFEKVFSAIEQGLCRFGILPIENSTAGSVNKVYDLMLKHNFYIVKSARIKTASPIAWTTEKS